MTDTSNIISLHPTQPKWTLKRIEDERERSVMAEKVRLPIDHFLELLDLAEITLKVAHELITEAVCPQCGEHPHYGCGCSTIEILEAENKAINAELKARVNAHEAELEKMWADHHADMADKIAAVKENTKNMMINAVKTVEREQRTDDAALRLVVKFKARLSEEFGVTI